jgi:S1-C subfamily serine protease
MIAGEEMMKNRKSKSSKSMLASMCLLLGVGLLTNWVWADEVAEQSKKVIEKRQDAVISVKIIIEVYESERKLEALGTVIHESGLTLVSMSSMDPGAMFSSGMSETKVKDVTMIMPDMEEIPAKVVLRDQDLDIVFIEPSEKLKKKLIAIDLSDNSEPEMLDQVVALSRLGSSGGYAAAVSIMRIQSIITKPRTMYMADPLKVFVSGLGTPAFSLDGKVIGMLLLRVSKTQEGISDELRGIGGFPSLPIILPVSEILDVIEKAKLLD